MHDACISTGSFNKYHLGTNLSLMPSLIWPTLLCHANVKVIYLVHLCVIEKNIMKIDIYSSKKTLCDQNMLCAVQSRYWGQITEYIILYPTKYTQLGK